MSQLRTISIEAAEVKPVETQLPLVEIDKHERLMRAAKSLAIVWACAGFSAFIPIIHFISVPGLTLAGIFFAANAYSDDVRLGETKISCPKCGQPIEIKNRSDQFPKWQKCTSCHADIKLNAINA
jgi:hypothetical protein